MNETATPARPQIEPIPCPICQAPEIVELPDDWSVQVQHHGKAIPIIGCGNPWHYRGRGLDPDPIR